MQTAGCRLQIAGVLCLTLAFSPFVDAQTALNTCRIEGVAVRCGTVSVSENHESHGRKIGLRVFVIPAASAADNPPLFVVNGGPGASTVEMAALFFDELAVLRARRDIVLVDQRGTGGSNALHCDAAAAGAIVPADVNECLRQLQRAADLRFYGTDDAVRDLDRVRAVLGYDRIDIAGISYGTRVTWWYAKRFPSRLRAVVMVSPNPPSQRLLASVGEDFQRAIRLLAADCRGDRECGQRFPRFDEELTALRDTLTPAQRMALPLLLYSADGARRLPWMVNQAAAGNKGPIEAALSAVLDTVRRQISLGAYLSVQCREELAGENAGRDPLAAALRNEYAAACRNWPRAAPPPGFRDRFESRARALIIAGEWDPATPPRWAEAAAGYFAKPTVAIVPKGAHGLSGVGTCLGAMMAQFLDGGAMQTGCLNALAQRKYFLGGSSN